jgi:hypothetical protein
VLQQHFDVGVQLAVADLQCGDALLNRFGRVDQPFYAGMQLGEYDLQYDDSLGKQHGVLIHCLHYDISDKF